MQERIMGNTACVANQNDIWMDLVPNTSYVNLFQNERTLFINGFTKFSIH